MDSLDEFIQTNELAELLKQRNQERLRENVRKSIANDMISDYNNVLNKPRYETESNNKVKFFENQEAVFP